MVATADRGLAGGFNSSIVRAAREHIASSIAQGREVSVLTIGRKSRDQLRRLYGARFVANLEAGTNPSLERAQEVASLVAERFEAGEADVVTLFFSRFRSVVSQVPTARQLIPAAGRRRRADHRPEGRRLRVRARRGDHPRDAAAAQSTVQIFAAMLENQAGFFASQMAAMDNATRNAGDMIARLTLQYNRARQAQVTKELIEIISGAEAL